MNRRPFVVSAHPFVVSLSNHERPFGEQQDRPFDKLSERSIGVRKADRASGLNATHLPGVWGWEYVILRE